MRINVYSQELTDEVQPVEKVSDTGIVYSAVCIMLQSPTSLHHTCDDDDRSGITFWLPKSADRREDLAQMFEDVAYMIRRAKPETGSDA